MGKDSVREKDTMIGGGGCGGRKSARPVSASPYSENYRPPMDLCQRHLINHRLLVSKLTRRELEDKYIVLCDENYSMKKRVHEQEDLIKRLKTKLMRASSESNCRSKSRLELGSNEHYNRLHDLESQRRELHEKLEALRRATSSDVRRMDSVTGGSTKPTGGTRHTSGAVNGQGQHRRSKSAAHRTKDREPSRCKSSSPSNDDYEEHCRVREQGPAKDRRSTDHDDEDDEDIEEEVQGYANGGRARSGPRKSYGADDEDEGEDDEDRERDGDQDQDRDVASCTGVSEENGDVDQRSASGASGGGATRNAKFRGSRSRPSAIGRPVAGNCADCERHHSEQLVRETDIVKMKLNIKYLHKELQNEKEKSALLARQLEERLSYEIMKRNAAENIEILNLNRQVEDMTRELQRQVDEQRRSMEHEIRKQGDLEAQIRKEKDKNSELFEECERLKKSIEKLKENMSEVEIERDFLKRQQENFTKIVDENKLLKYQLDDLRKHNQGLLKQIDTLKEEELVTRASQKELLEKLKTLQQDNDTLSVMLEGLRTENEVLAEEKSLLEQSLKSLEASPIRELTPTPPLSSPQKPLLADVCSQTELENRQTVSESVVFDPDRALASSKSEPQATPLRSSHSSPKRSSLKSSRNGGELAAQGAAPTTQQLLRQVTVGQTIPKLSRILNNRIEERHKPSNVELLLMNSYPAELEKSFRRNERFRAIQSSLQSKRETTDRGSIVSSGSERRKISFAESSATDETKDDESVPESVERNYARLFGFGRQPSMWHTVANPLQPAPADTSPRPQHATDRLTIEIQSVRWHESAIELLQADGVSVYYVEFRFLDLHGHQLETPESAPLVTGTSGLRLQHDFHYQVPIELDPNRNPERCAQLKAMLGPEGRDVLTFVLVNERQDCEDIGYATVRLRSELTAGCHGHAEELLVRAPIYDFRRDHDEMGMLTVKFENVALLRTFMTAE